MDNVITGPPLPTTFMNEIDKSFANYILDYIRENEDRPILINGETDEKLLLSELAEKSLNLAAQLQALGCNTDTCVAVYSENGIDNMIAVLAIFLSGATSVTLNPSFTLDELHHAVSLSKPVLFFCSETTHQKTKETQKSHPFIRNIIISTDSVTDSKSKLFSELIQKSNQKYQEPSYDPERTLMILLSSGTTGLPKGVMLSNRNALFQLHMTTRANTFNFSGNVLSTSNMYHVSGMFLPFFVLTLGKTLVISTKPDDEDFFVSLIPKYKIKSVLRTTSFIINLIKSGLAEKYDISSLEHIVTTASPLNLSIESEALDNLKIKRIQTMYGMTENSSYVVIRRKHNTKRGTLGAVAPGIVIKIRDPQTNQNLGFGEIGEICYKGPSIMKGYLNNPEATSDTIRDGWLHSGDLGYYDADGDLFYIDRIKELIKYHGVQIAPVELEEILMQHSAVKDAAVIGIPDEEAGELPKAFVVKKHGRTISQKEILDHVASKVSPWKNLHGGVAFVDEIPRNSSGKILRRKIKEMHSTMVRG